VLATTYSDKDEKYRGMVHITPLPLMMTSLKVISTMALPNDDKRYGTLGIDNIRRMAPPSLEDIEDDDNEKADFSSWAEAPSPDWTSISRAVAYKPVDEQHLRMLDKFKEHTKEHGILPKIFAEAS